MSLLSFLFGGNIEIIEWIEERNDLVLWKFPDKDRDIKYGAQLTVMESQQAILVNEGQIADVYYSGRHELYTENMPMLTALKHWEYGFKSPFKVDIYYISSRQFTDLKWGTSQPILISDAQFGEVRVSAFGVYFIKISDPAKFFSEFAGTHPTLLIDEIETRLRGLIAPAFGECISESNIPLNRLTSQFSELGEELKPIIQKTIEPFGIEITHFQISSVSLPPEISAAIDRNTANHIESGTTLNTTNQKLDNNIILLEELAALKEKGILTEEEFLQKKAEILNRI
jgi:membrane protease subunit (stomatin/prohibitin family)